MKHYIVPDVQVTPEIDTTFLTAIGKHIVEERPEVIVCLGDFWDMHSLSSYDKGRKSSEGRRVQEDIDSGIVAMRRLLRPLKRLQSKQRKNKKKVYQPRMVFLLGNHEERIARHVESNAELSGFLSYDNLRLESMGWEVYDFLDPVVIDDIAYAHYFANPMSGRPFGGTLQNMLQKVGRSFVMGHQQRLDYTTRGLSTGEVQFGLVVGACYEHDEGYKGYQGNHHFRGTVVLDSVENGYGDMRTHSITSLREKYRV